MIAQPALRSLLSPLLFTALTLVTRGPALAQTAAVCARATAATAAVTDTARDNVRPLRPLFEKIAPGTQFAIHYSTYTPRIDVVIEGRVAGQIHPAARVDPYGGRETEDIADHSTRGETEREVYESHIELDESARGQGLGSVLYVLMAQTIYNHGGILYSTTAPSSKAEATWQRLVEAGWAERLPFRDRDDVFRYRVKPALLEGKFFEFPAALIRAD